MIKNIAEYIKAVTALRKSWVTPDDPEPTIWFRGVSDSSYPLLPFAYREEWEEETMFLHFKAHAPHYMEYEPSDDWEWYFLMRHYGLPTRLLDWTENALTGLYFALDDNEDSVEPCVWVMLPGEFNRQVHKLDKPILYAPASDGLIEWLPRNCGRDKKVSKCHSEPILKNNELPLALLPKRRNPRITAQQGVLTIHGIENEALDKLSPIKEGNIFSCLKIDVSVAQAIKDELFAIGITNAAIFPELDSVSKDIMKIHKIKKTS